MKQPKVSVVMSVFNDSKQLPIAVESILTQTGIDFEFIVINDGSTDDTPDVLAQYAKRDRRLIVVHRINRGLTRSLIEGCNLARGDFIARQDADDVSKPHRLSSLARLLREDEELAFVSSQGEAIAPRGEVLYVERRPVDSAGATKLLLNRTGPPGHGSVMMRRSAYVQVGGYRRQLYFAQDSDLWLRLVAVGKLNYHRDSLYQYRVDSASLSGRMSASKVAYLDIVTKLHEARLAGRAEESILLQAAQLSEQRAAGKVDSLADSQADTDYFIAQCLFKRGDIRGSSYLLASLRKRPRNLKAWLSIPAAISRLLSALAHEKLGSVRS